MPGRDRTRILGAALVAMAVFGSGQAHAQRIIHVDDDAPPGGFGETWATAVNDLTVALLGAQVFGDVSEIRIAQGVYVPTIPGELPPVPRSATFQMVDGVALRGGYRGLSGAGDPDDRDIAAFRTILSGDLAGDDGPGFTGNDENAVHVLTAIGLAHETLIEGVTVRGGNANGPGAGDAGLFGGGLQATGSTLLVVASTFQQNFGWRGGAIWGTSCDLALRDAAFIGNRARESGGGVYVGVASTLTATRSRFTQNVASDNQTAGGAVFADQSTSAFVSCTFVRNSAENLPPPSPGSRAIFSAGGAISASFGSVGVDQSLFVGNNTSTWGGAIGRGIGQAPFTLAVTNCAFVANVNGLTFGPFTGGGIGCSSAMPVTVSNSIFRDNIAVSYPDGIVTSNQLTQIDCPGAEINYSSVQDWDGTLGGIGNVGYNPRFVDPLGPDGEPATGDEDLRLRPNSPLIDAGSNPLVPADTLDLDADGDTTEPIPVDLLGNPRFHDDDGTRDIGVGPAPVVDMGPFEFQGTSCPADINGDGRADVLDFFEFIRAFATGDPIADISEDGQVDVSDFFHFVLAFSVGCP